MKNIDQVLIDLFKNPIEIPEYRPPGWESPIEKALWEALRHMGFSIDTQVAFGNYRVDMVVSSRRSDNKIIIECDGAEYHHRIIDEFRDDELLKLCGLTIVHVFGIEIARSAEKCALFIVERWFPEHMDTVGYSSTLEMVYEEACKFGDEDGPELYVDEPPGFFPIGYVRPVTGNLYPSYTDIKVRDLVRYITGDNDDHIFEEEGDKKLFWGIKNELKQRKLVKQKLSPQELARAYIVVYYDELTRSIELEKLDNFLIRLAIKNANSPKAFGG